MKDWSSKMKRRVVYRTCLIVMFLASITGIIILGYYNIDSRIPNCIHLLLNQEEKFDFSLPVQAEVVDDATDVFCVGQGSDQTGQIHFNFDEPFSMTGTELGTYQISLKLFGIIDYKTIDVTVIDKQYLIPGGEPIGIYIQSDGILVLGTSSLTCADGSCLEPALDTLYSGDYIVKMNDESLTDKNEFIEKIQENGAKEITLDVRRGKEMVTVKVKPVKTVDGEYKIGTWIRDDTQGIGTLTYIDLKGRFGALGHGITDVDTNKMMEIDQGTIYNAEVLEIIKGQSGTPGEIVGLIKTSAGNEIGTVDKNTEQGIFGEIDKENCQSIQDVKPLPIGLKQEIKIGKASILTSVEGKVKEYEIEIKDIQMNSGNLSKGLVIEITDPALLHVTNGIVQGMSGSPIIQNGKIIGAVTHVFIQDSTKGYGTFIENMIKTGNE